jgi:preprotein translocase subunit SecY
MTLGLGQRIAFTLGALLVYRIGTYIPLPGIDPAVLQQFFRGQRGMAFPVLSGDDAVHRLSIFALDIFPYISAAVIVQLLSLFFSRGSARSARQRSGEPYVLGLTAAFVGFQAFGIAFGLERVTGIVPEPGWLFRVSTVLSLIGSTFFLIWLSGLITSYGVGNGLALLLFVGVAAELPADVADLIELGRLGALSTDRIMALGVVAIAVLALVVFVELARRHVPVQYVRRQLGDRAIESQPSVLTLKINNAGVIPVVVASWFFSLQTSAAQFAVNRGPAWLNYGIAQFGHGRPGFMILATILIIFLALLYTALLFDPERAADRLATFGGVVPGTVPGAPTAEHLDFVLSRTTVVGAVYLALLYLLPEILILYWAPFYFSGISALILVCTVLDICTQVRGDGLITARGIRQ